jgi:hypothetical protein
VSDRDVDEFVAAAVSHRRGPRSVEALLAENERLREALRCVERIAAEHEGVSADAYEAITDVTRAASAAAGTGAAP